MRSLPVVMMFNPLEYVVVMPFAQRHPFAQLAAQNLVFLAQEIILLGQILAEELLDLDEEGSGGAAKTGFHSIEITRPYVCLGPETPHSNIERASEYLHGTCSFYLAASCSQPEHPLKQYKLLI
jgi:hypothetical protein